MIGNRNHVAMTKHHSSSNNNSSNINRSTTSNYTNSSHTKKAFKAFHNKKHSRDRVPDTATSSTIVVATDSCQKEQKLTKQQKRDLKRNQKAIEARAITSNNNREQQNNVCSVYKRKTVYPPVMKDFKGPRGRFLNPTDADFVNVLQRCYRGFACERKETFSLEFHSKFRMAFEGLEEDEAYQFDMTQPAGLGTKLAKTFVTRCLVGEPGTTYKYLGLRMFALPWSKEAKGSTPHTVAIGEVNNALIERSDALLKKSGSELYGSCRYNLTLINRCYPENSAGSSVIKLKDEPVFKNEKCSVSWHADSTLEHFSTIAVYHYTKHDQKKSDSFASDDESWRIALRLWYDAEGPNMGKSHSKSSEMKDNFVAPLLAYPLPNQSAYFLLDDFNHHHQHSGTNFAT